MAEPNLTTELLRTLVTVVDADGFNRAAAMLHKTPSTISQQIQRLEAEVGTALFEPSGRKRRLTPAGERFVAHARRLLAMQQNAVAAALDQDLRGEIRLGVAQGLSEGPFAHIIADYSRRNPRVRLHVDVAYSCDLTSDFEDGRYDAILVVRRGGRGPGRLLGQASLEWITAEGFEWDPDSPLPLAMFDTTCAFRDAALDALNEAGIPWSIVYTTTSLPGLMAAVRNGLAVTARTGNALVDGCVLAGRDLRLPHLPKVDMVLRCAARTSLSDSIKALFMANPPPVA